MILFAVMFDNIHIQISLIKTTEYKIFYSLVANKNAKFLVKLLKNK